MVVRFAKMSSTRDEQPEVTQKTLALLLPLLRHMAGAGRGRDGRTVSEKGRPTLASTTHTVSRAREFALKNETGHRGVGWGEGASDTHHS